VDKTIYIVFAQAGSYSTEDTDSWIVCAYEDEALAKQHARKAQMRWQRIRRAVQMWQALRMHNWPPKTTTWLGQLGDPREGANPYDPGMRYNDTLWYEVLAIPVLASVQKITLTATVMA